MLPFDPLHDAGINRDRMTFPNFLLIGAMKAGTTALYHFLRQHPQVYMSPKKEPQFFAYECWEPRLAELQSEALSPELRGCPQSYMVSTLADYVALFSAVGTERAIGEASAHYLHLPRAIARIRHYVPKVRLFAVLRHPAERAYSSFMHMRRDGLEPFEDFADALEQEDSRVRETRSLIWAYRRLGFYAESVRLYQAHFDPARIRFFLYDDLTNDPSDFLKDIFGFIGVDPDFKPDLSIRYNISGMPARPGFYKWLGEPHAWSPIYKALVPEPTRHRVRYALLNRMMSKPAPMAPELRSRLIAGYREDILRLQDLIDRDLTHWLAEA